MEGQVILCIGGGGHDSKSNSADVLRKVSKQWEILRSRKHMHVLVCPKTSGGGGLGDFNVVDFLPKNVLGKHQFVADSTQSTVGSCCDIASRAFF
jgi:hypothetical protein